jgi:hypothetical protein
MELFARLVTLPKTQLGWICCSKVTTAGERAVAMQLWKEWEVAMHPGQKEGGWQPLGLQLCGWFEEACSD